MTQQISAIPDAFLSQYGAGCSQANPTACPAYLTSYSIGQTTLASPELKPEKSRSFTGGLKFDPIRSVSLTVDYYNIKKTGAITTPDNSAAIAAYYAGAAPVAGFEVIADAPDDWEPQLDWEHDDHRWCSPGEAVNTLRWPETARALAESLAPQEDGL